MPKLDNLAMKIDQHIVGKEVAPPTAMPMAHGHSFNDFDLTAQFGIRHGIGRDEWLLFALFAVDSYL